jgi:hypothetical protein
VETLPLAIANGWASGLSAYTTVLVIGLLGRTGVADTPAGLQRTDVLVAVGILALLEFVADKIPYVDSLWDTVHTVVRPVIAAVVGALLAGDADTLGQALAATCSSATALLSHLVKGGLRLAVNTSPEPASNVGVSLTEDVSVVGITLLAWQHPWAAAAIALVLLAGGIALAVFLLRRVRRGRQGPGSWRRWLRGDRRRAGEPPAAGVLEGHGPGLGADAGREPRRAGRLPAGAVQPGADGGRGAPAGR